MSVDKFAKRTLIRQLTLPSQGKLYPNLPTGQVRVAAISSREDKLLAGSGNSTTSKLDLMLDRLIDAGALSPNDMLLVDRLFCLFHIRSLSYGDTYTFEYRCSACGRKQDMTVDIMIDLAVTPAPEDFKEPYEVVLPHSRLNLGLRYFRGSDEQAVAQFAMKNAGAPLDEGDPAFFYRLSRHIATINGRPVAAIGCAEAVELVQNLEGPDTLAFRRALNGVPFGIALTKSVACTACGEREEVGIPFTSEFFRPTA